MLPRAYPAAPPVLRPNRGRLRWYERLLLWLGFAALGVVVLMAGLSAFGYWSWATGRMNRWFLELGAKDAAKNSPHERPWPPAGQEPPDTWPGPRPDAGLARRPADLFLPDRVWEAHLRFTQKQWNAAQPETVKPAINIFHMEAKIPLRNPHASRSGVLGALGLDLPWSTSSVEFGGVSFTNVATRFKGNGTYLGSYYTFKRPYKVDLNRGAAGRLLAGVDTLNLHNLTADFSGVSDALSYEFFRAAGVPAPRTTYARVLLTIEGRFNRRPLGLYVVVEDLDKQWAKEVLGTKHAALFKPVTYELFKDLGDQWSAYDAIYAPKQKLTPSQERRVIDLAKLVSHAPDEAFAARLADYFDLTEVARFIAGHVLLSSYDGFLNNGQNFLMYLDPRTDRFGFIPWDMDHSWGEFGLAGTPVELETASIMRPWVADNRFLERLFAVESFRKLYRAELEHLFNTQFDPERLARRVDELAAVIRPTVQEESDYRKTRFEEAVTGDWSKEPHPPRSRVPPSAGGSSGGGGDSAKEPRSSNRSDPRPPTHQIKRFLVKRAESVREQLEGRSEGHLFPIRSLPH